MVGYSPLKITGMSTGLVQERENFLLPNDAYPTLQNAYVWRERIKRKRGYELLGRLQRNASTTGTSSAGSTTTFFNILSILSIPETTASITPGTVTFTLVAPDLPATFTDNGRGGFTVTGNGLSAGSFVNYATGEATFNFVSPTLGGGVTTVSVGYYPGLPVMGIRIRELQNSSNNQTIFFDQVYAYTYNSGISQFQEWIPGTTWNADGEDVSGTDFFWSTNYWASDVATFGMGTLPGTKLFWVTNGSGHSGVTADPPRITDGITWVDFFPSTWSQIDSAPSYLTNWLCMLPFRGRMVTFNTWEGPDAANSLNYSNRIRWSAIGNPFIAYSAGPPATGSWRDDIRGRGGFLDIPTSEDIVSVGFVRDNLVIYCERSTWQLRYTGRSIAPFQVEKVNSELGTESTFSSVQFDTSLVGIGDKGIVECDSYKSERIDIKIPDFVFQFNTRNDGVSRIQGIRDFPNRLAYWTIPLTAAYSSFIPTSSQIFPNTRLVYNYENDSWATFNDSLTALGNYQEQTSRTWLNTHKPWTECNFPWINQPIGDPQILGGNQQGFIEILNQLTVNDVSLAISAITPGMPITITSANHNLYSGAVIGISGIPTGTPFDSLNGGVFFAQILNADHFTLYIYNPEDDEFSTATSDSTSDPYIGGGLINIRENFSIVSKKFNFLDEGQNIQLGYLDILMESTGASNPGAISLSVYMDYDDENPSNKYPDNVINNDISPGSADTFFNSVIPTTASTLNNNRGTKFWQRVYCATRANFITLQYLFNNSQMAGVEQTLDVQIDAQVLWIRKAGRMTQI